MIPHTSSNEAMDVRQGQESTRKLVLSAACKLREATMPFPSAEHLPWRNLRTPYRIFLAELLLVRTRSDVVARVFEEIALRYPDVLALANADQGELTASLEPLGLRKRAPFLPKAAQYILKHHQGRIPEKVEELMKVPGLGLYTATAVAAFAYGSSEVPADVNILRFLSRLTGLPMKHPTKGSPELRALLPLLSREQGGPEPEKLLDFTRLICHAKHPRCGECPLQDDCWYASLTSPDRELP
jgi:A/G-specific adenine glycosylase